MTRTIIIASLLLSMTTFGQDISDDSWKTYKGADGSVNSSSMPLPVDTPDTVRATHIDPPKKPGKVTFKQDQNITDLINSYNGKRHTLKGYRVQVFLGERTEANKVRSEFQSQHPQIPVYLSYLAPNFRVRVGDLRDRAEAEGLRYKLKNTYSGAYIVPDEIEWPRLP